MQFHLNIESPVMNWALCRLLLLILPDRVARHIFPQASTPPILTPDTAVTHTSDPQHVHRVSSCDKCRVTINALPDDVLLHVFHFYRLPVVYILGQAFPERPDRRARLSWRWNRLVHVCRRWRSVVFASPNVLNLKLVCRPWTPVELTAIWPPLPIIIRDGEYRSIPEDYDFDAVIVHHNRVCEIDIHFLKTSQCQRLASAMQNQFPALIRLSLAGTDGLPAVALPDGLLGVFPSLQSLTLANVALSALPERFLSATNLVSLTLDRISGHISPEEIVAGLAVLANLRDLDLQSPRCRLDGGSRRRLAARTVLHALNRFTFLGVSKYLEDLVARIDAPSLDTISIAFFTEPVFDITQLAQFMRCTTRFQALNEAHVVFDKERIEVESQAPKLYIDHSGFRIACGDLDRWEFSQVFTSLSPSIHMVESLYIHGFRNFCPPDTESIQWLEAFHPFTAVKNLYIIKEFAQCVAPALQKLVGDRATDMLPSLENIFLEELEPSGPIQEGIGKFVAARQLSGRPITVSLWEAEFDRLGAGLYEFQIMSR